MNQVHPGRAERLLLALYPARYRDDLGADAVAVLAEATHGLGRLDRCREYLDLAAHAARLRLRISATDPAGRLLAGAAPLALTLFAGEVLCLGLSLAIASAVVDVPIGPPGSRLLKIAALIGLMVVALLAHLAGRWRTARLFTALGALTTVAVQAALIHRDLSPLLAFTALLAVLALLAPPDLVETTRRSRWESAAVVLAIAVPMILPRFVPVPFLFYYAPTILPFGDYAFTCLVAAAVLAVRCAAGRLDVPHLTGVPLAAAVVGVLASGSVGFRAEILAAAMVLGLILGAAAHGIRRLFTARASQRS
ncbi:hypothetical protein ACWEQL_35015 [Kitasatospora sp. NPDC004240]